MKVVELGVTTAVWRLSSSSQPCRGSGHDGPWISVVNLWMEVLPYGNLFFQPTLLLPQLWKLLVWVLRHTFLPV